MAEPTAHSRNISYEFIISLFIRVCSAQSTSINVDVKIHMNFAVKYTQATVSNIYTYSTHVAFITR
jgi:hypothetical protein